MASPNALIASPSVNTGYACKLIQILSTHKKALEQAQYRLSPLQRDKVQSMLSILNENTSSSKKATRWRNNKIKSNLECILNGVGIEALFLSTLATKKELYKYELTADLAQTRIWWKGEVCPEELRALAIGATTPLSGQPYFVRSDERQNVLSLRFEDLMGFLRDVIPNNYIVEIVFPYKVEEPSCTVSHESLRLKLEFNHMLGVQTMQHFTMLS